jgi:formamidopyrimidine-DNA glycosylase
MVPELPDVEVYRKYLDATSLHKEIEGVSVFNSEVLQGTSARQLRLGLKGRRFTSTRRHGKYLFAKVEGDGWLVLHFGMTGRLRYFKKPGHEPEHARVSIDFANGYHLAYDSQRKLGIVSMAESVEGFVAKKGLGPDALEMDAEVFMETFRGRRGSVKPALMRQGLMAGVGNVYADEILFHAGVRPDKRLRDLGDSRLNAIYVSMREVLEEAVEAGADPRRFPKACLLPQRREGGRCPRCGAALRKTRLSGRGTFYCPRHQK